MNNPIEDIFMNAGIDDEIAFAAAKICRETGIDPYAVLSLLRSVGSKSQEGEK